MTDSSAPAPGKKKVLIDYRGTLSSPVPKGSDWPQLIDDLRQNGHDVSLATGDSLQDLAKPDVEYLQKENIEILENSPKNHEIWYKSILVDVMGWNLADVVLIDDNDKCVQKAIECGAQAIQYKAEEGGIPAVRTQLVDMKLLLE